MKKTFFKFVTRYNLFYQFMFFVAVFALLTLFNATFLYQCVPTIEHSSFAKVLAALITGDLGKLGYSKLFQSAYFAMTSVIVLIWQSVLIIKFLNRPDYLVTSRVLTYYPMGNHNQASEKADFLVFRLMNDGYEDLYDVEIKVTYRFFHEESETFQHYCCTVKNQHLPILSPKMPFRIYIESGIMKNIRDLYLDPAGIHKEDAEKNSLTRVTKEGRPQDEIIVFITGYDSALDQTKSYSCRYKFKDLQHGEFTSIEPENGIFLDEEINHKFNQIENNGVWK